MSQSNTNQAITLFYAEDEKPARDKLSHQLSLLDNIDVIGFATTGKEAVSSINELRPDIILLDVQMPELDGLDVVDLLDYHPVIIYTTAYEQYAVSAFEKSSLDYLLKPYPLSRLKAAIEKAVAVVENQRKLHQQDTALAPMFTSSTPELKKLVSKQGDRIFLLSPSEIKFIKSEQRSTLAWHQGKFLHLGDTLDQLEAQLEQQNFIRIHRSYMINLDHVKEIQRYFNGKLMVIINDENNTELSTSRAGADKLKALLNI